VARAGNVAPGLGAGVYFNHPFVPSAETTSGAFGFGAAASGLPPSGIGTGAWAGSAGTPALLAFEAMQAPGTPPGVVFDELLPPGIGGGVQVIQSSVTGAGVSSANDRGVWRNDASGQELLLREGVNAPDVTPPRVVTSLFQPSVGPDGTIAVIASFAGNEEALYTDSGDGLELLLQPGDPAPGVEEAAYARFFEALVDGAGRVAFVTFLDTFGGDALILQERQGGFAVVARQGDAAPEIPSASYFVLGGLSLGASGAIAFETTLSGAGVGADEDRALYRDLGAEPELLLREGDRAGSWVPPDTTTIQFVDFTDLFDAEISDGGRLVVHAWVEGPPSDADEWLFWFEPDGTRIRLLAEGQPIEVAPGDDRVVANFHVAGTEPGRPTGAGVGINDRRVAARVHFTDGTQAIVLVPEPDSGAATIASLAALAAWFVRAAGAAIRR
jgi:hypothetical protein